MKTFGQLIEERMLLPDDVARAETLAILNRLRDVPLNKVGALSPLDAAWLAAVAMPQLLDGPKIHTVTLSDGVRMKDGIG